MHYLTTETLRGQKQVGSTRQLQEQLILREKQTNPKFMIEASEPQRKPVWSFNLNRFFAARHTA